MWLVSEKIRHEKVASVPTFFYCSREQIRLVENGLKQSYTCMLARNRQLKQATNLTTRTPRVHNLWCQGPDTPDAIRQRDAIFRFSLTDNFDPSLNFPNI
jgi:hypothetical protein